MEMTDFLSWWADHWPLIPALIAWCWAFAYLTAWFLDIRMLGIKRRREP